MRISDWSSDVCSSDLLPLRYATRVPGDGFGVPGGDWGRDPLCRYGPFRAQGGGPELVDAGLSVPDAQLYGSGRAAARHTRSGREPVLPDGAGMGAAAAGVHRHRSEEHTSELQSLMRLSYAVFCLTKQNTTHT